MSVEPSEIVSEVWTRWQGHLINGVFPLGRYLGCSDHSGVFLTRSAACPSELAIKLVPTNRTLAECQLPRWKRAGSLAHAHLLPLVEWGGCQLDGLPYLYTVMEHGDQTLAQLLLKRALTDDEAREMLSPILDALAFLHGRSLVQGQLKPSNILVVGDQLKLASDTIRRVSEGRLGTHPPTAYDPPEAREEITSSASDIWALGVTLLEALTRRPPSGKPGEPVMPPADFPPSFRDIVARSLSPAPQDRPSVRELMRWAGGEATLAAPAATTQPAPLVPIVPIEPVPPEPRQPKTTTAAIPSQAARPTPSAPGPTKPQAWLAVALGAVVLVALGWIGLRAFRSSAVPAAAPPAVQMPAGSSSQSADITAEHPSGEVRLPPNSAASTARPGRSEAAAPPSALHEAMPEVSPGARRTIRGHIKVWVRVTVGRDGRVFAAVPDRAGPSRYFQNAAIDAAKKWTFPPVDAPSERVMQIRFDFSHEGTTGRAVALH